MRYKKIYTGIIFISILATVPAVASAQRRDTLLIHFNSNESRILSEDSLAMDKLLKTRSRIISISLSGHCDYIGDDRYNDSLSRERVRATRTWLAARGLPDSTFRDFNDFGKRKPLNNNSTDQERGLNRRVEIVFISITPPASIPYLEAAFRDTAHLSGRKNILLKKITFYGDRHFPLPEGYLELQELRKILQEHPGIRIEIQGYVCCNAPDQDGYDKDTHTPDLSVQRAKYIYQYLIKTGIDSFRMTYRGFGARYPISPTEDNDEQRRMNRRVELKVLKQ